MTLKHAGWAALLLTISTTVEPCTITRPVSPEEVVQGADAIVRVTAVEYARSAKEATFPQRSSALKPYANRIQPGSSIYSMVYERLTDNRSGPQMLFRQRISSWPRSVDFDGRDRLGGHGACASGASTVIISSLD